MPDFPNNPTPGELAQTYSEGFEGWRFNQDTWNEFIDNPTSRYQSISADIRGTGKGKRALLYRSREKFDPGAFGQEAQTTGDCVSHGSRNARDITRCVEIDIKGELESYLHRGATEPTYGARGFGGQGMDPADAAEFERDVGFMVRMNYPGVVDLSEYDSSIGSGWGRRGVPENVKEICREHNVGSYTLPQTVEEARDLLANGYAIHSGQSFGVSESSNSDGICRKWGSWNHDMATIAMDDTGAIYPSSYGTVFLIANSWGHWNNRPAVWPVSLLGEWPIGSFWIDEETYSDWFIGSGSIMAYSQIRGFAPKKLPNYGVSLAG